MSNAEDDLETAARTALGEVLNLAAQIAEMQMSEEARSDIYELLDTVAEHYGIERTEIVIDDDEEGTVVISYSKDDESPSEESEEENKLPSYITLAVDNDKKLH